MFAGIFKNLLLISSPICGKAIGDIIKRNESDVGDIVFEILAKTVFKFFCFILIFALTKSS